MCEVTGALKAISGEKFKRKIRFYYSFFFIVFPQLFGKALQWFSGIVAKWEPSGSSKKDVHIFTQIFVK